MGEVGFYLKKADKGKSALIYLQFRYQGNKLVYSFGQTIDPKNWNKTKQRVKSNNQTTADGQYSLNDLLDNLRDECLKAYNTEIKSGVPAPAVLKQYLVNFFEGNTGREEQPSLFTLIERFISGEIKHRGRDRSLNTLKQYKSTYNHLQRFAKEKKQKVDFDTITIDFYYKFTEYLNQRGQKPNSIGKNIKNLKAFLSEAVDLGLTTNMQFKHKKFTVWKEAADTVYLTEKEIMQLYNYNLSAVKRLEQARDLFVFGCFTGLRFADYNDVKPDNLVTIEGEQYIRLITKKTRYEVIIPANHVIKEIFEKYKDNLNRLPKSISNQKLNEYIKEVAEAAGLTEKGRLSTDMSKPLYACISSHTARRSMATNLYLSGFPTIDIMKITGHTTEKAFLTYIKVSKLDTAKRLNEHYKKGMGSAILKVI